MSHEFKNRWEWELDLLERQRSIVFPDTAFNAGRFYRNLTNERFGLVGWIGVIILIVMTLAPTIFAFPGVLSVSFSGSLSVVTLLQSLGFFFVPGLFMYILLLALVRQIARKPDQN